MDENLHIKHYIEINSSLVKIKEICPERVTNQVNKQVILVCLLDLQLSREILPIF